MGEILHKKRVSLKLEYEKVEEATKIRSKFLQAIEKGEYSKLPPEAFLVGFIKNYATFLGLDPEKMVAMYKKETGIQENIKKRYQPKKKQFKVPKIIITPKTVLLYFIVVISITVLSYIVWQVRILAAPPKIEITQPVNNSSTESDYIEIVGKTDAGADVFINDYLIGGSPDGNFKEKVSLQNGLNTIRLKAKNKVGKETTKEVNIAANLKPVVPAKTEEQKVDLKVDVGPNSAWIYVEVDGQAVDKDGMVLLSGATRTFVGKEKVTLTTKNAGSTSVSFNGKDIGALGKEGELVKNREFTKDMQIR